MRDANTEDEDEDEDEGYKTTEEQEKDEGVSSYRRLGACTGTVTTRVNLHTTIDSASWRLTAGGASRST